MKKNESPVHGPFTPGKISLRTLRSPLAALVLVTLFVTGAQAVPPPAGIAPFRVPTGGLAIDGDLLANSKTVGEGDWLLATNLVPTGTGTGVIRMDGSPIDFTTTFHIMDAWNDNN